MKFAEGFRSLEKEVVLEDLKVKGQIPNWLNGSLVRTAPSKFETERKPLNHWFDGYAMLHQFTFDHGKLSYRNKYLQSNAYKEMKEKGKMIRRAFATDPCQSVFGYFFSLFRSPDPNDNGNVNVSIFGDELVALTETPMPVVFDRNTLETHGILPFEDDAEGELTVAHPHFDQEKNLYSYLLKFGFKSEFKLYKMSYGSRKREIFATIPSRYPAYIHSFGYTEHYIILVEFALVVNPIKLKFSGKPLIANYEWKPELGTRFHVVDKKSGKLVNTLVGSPIFCFHHVNAFEENDEIMVDLIAYEDAQIVKNLYLKKLRHQPIHTTGKLWRYRLNPSTGSIQEEKLSDAAIELPRIDDRFNGLSYRYLFATANKVPGNFLDSLLMRDMHTGLEKWWIEAHTYPGEPVFVPKPDSDKEAEGVVLSVVLNANTSQSFLLVLDALSFEEMARAELPHHVPFGFHGNYFPDHLHP